MKLDLHSAPDAGLTPALLEAMIDHHERSTLPRLELLWTYYRNPMQSAPGPARGADPDGSARRYRLGQERGLPSRLTGCAGRAWGQLTDDRALWSRKEVVIENDIAWRIHTMVDFMFGRPVAIASGAPDPAKRRLIERVLEAVWEASGGIALMQDLALLGHVYGHVDLIVRVVDRPARGSDSDPSDQPSPGDDETVTHAARCVRVEVVEPTRGVALLNEQDYRKISAYVLRYRRQTRSVRRPGVGEEFAAGVRSAGSGLLRRLMGNAGRAQDPVSAPSRESVTVTEVLTGAWRQVFEHPGDERGGVPRLVEEGPALVDASRPIGLGPPVVHIQNISQPFVYEGLGEVEPLVPLQDELNTRLSDRASRVTLASFKMLLAKGLSDVEGLAVAPGVVWQTDNPDARVESFGGDASSPSEDRHVEEIREAMDKVSGVPPLAAGVVRAKIGNLSSENALRVTLMGLLSKTARKRVGYGHGIGEACRLILEALDRLGILATTEQERTARVEWPDPLPRDERDALDAAARKIELGVSRERVLAELGYTSSREPTPPVE